MSAAQRKVKAWAAAETPGRIRLAPFNEGEEAQGASVAPPVSKITAMTESTTAGPHPHSTAG